MGKRTTSVKVYCPKCGKEAKRIVTYRGEAMCDSCERVFRRVDQQQAGGRS